MVLTKNVWERTQKTSHFETASKSFQSKTSRCGNAAPTPLHPWFVWYKLQPVCPLFPRKCHLVAAVLMVLLCSFSTTLSLENHLSPISTAVGHHERSPSPWEKTPKSFFTFVKGDSNYNTIWLVNRCQINLKVPKRWGNQGSHECNSKNP